jgi:predicted TIM-barrel fold metal-dependent hydrolase
MPTRIIDTDTHFIESPDLWTSRLPAKWRDSTMNVQFDKSLQREMWYIGDVPFRAAWANAVFGWGDGSEQLLTGPPTQADAHPATYDVNARVQLMDSWGVDLAVLYPNVAGVGLNPFLKHPDPVISVAHVRAYNDAQLEWVKNAPGRFIPMIVLPFWDLAASVAEVERLANECFGGVVTTGAPHQHGLPYLRDRHWDPLWRACEIAGLSVSFHVANGDTESDMVQDRLELEGTDLSTVRLSVTMSLDNAKQVVDLLVSGILPRFPDLKFVAVESGMGWVPFVLDFLDYRFKKNRVWQTHTEFGSLIPSDLFRRQVFVNFWIEELRDFHVERVGLDSLLFETDFPHPTGLYLEHFDETLGVAFGSQPESVRNRVLWDNPARLYKRSLQAQGVAV